MLGYIDPGTGFRIFSLTGWSIALLFGFLGIFLFVFRKFYNFLKKHKKGVGVIILALSTLIILGVAMTAKKSEFNQKLVILGFDGMSPEIMEPMMNKGKLPYFSQLLRQGSYAYLATTNPSQSPVAWAAFATGKNPGKNGIFDFIIRDPKTYKLSLSISDTKNAAPKRILRTKAFWQYTSQLRIPAVVIHCPLTFPPDKITGKMLSGMGVPDILGTEGTFTFYATGPLSAEKDIGGNVFQVKKSQVMTLNLIGPKSSSLFGKIDAIKVPFHVTLKGNDAVHIQYQKQEFELKKGQWSGWREVAFVLGIKKIKGIAQFYLAEIDPEFKLYISPINFDPRDPFFPISFPGGYSKTLAGHIGLYHTQGMPLDTWAVNEKRLSEDNLLFQANEVYNENMAMLNLELQCFKKGVFFCYFGSLDTIQHMFWRYGDPGHSLYEKNATQAYDNVIEEWYEKMDEVLGTAMRRLDQKDTLIVLSDHGFSAFKKVVHVNSWLRENGYLYLNQPDQDTGGELLRDVDWDRTKAYAIGFGAIYINQKNREINGIVLPGKDTEFLKEEIAGKLEQWIDKNNNSPVIKRVYKSQEIFRGQYEKEAPDLYIGFNLGYRASWQTALGASPARLLEDNLKKWSGDHLFDPEFIPGVIFSNRKITKNNPAIYDIAPSILRIIGYSDKEIESYDFDGKPLF